MQKRITLFLIAACAISACGFRPKGSVNLPFQSLYVNLASNFQLGSELRLGIEEGHAKVITDAKRTKDAQVILDVLADQREKVVQGLNVSGQVREFQLRQRFRFKLRSQDGRELIPETELLLERSISYSETTALAKESEEIALYKAMQSDIASQVLRRLSAVKL